MLSALATVFLPPQFSIAAPQELLVQEGQPFSEFQSAFNAERSPLSVESETDSGTGLGAEAEWVAQDPNVVPVPALNPPRGGQPPAVTYPPPASTTEQQQFQPQIVRPLPGQLDKVPVFYSNSPEMVRSEGILLSTFPPQGKGSPEAHLNFPLQGRFDVFAHHVTQTNYAESTPTMYIGILLYNPGDRTVDVDVLQGASFLSTPDAPFRRLPALMDNPVGYVYSGPGSRVMSQVLRGRRQTQLPSSVSIAPRSAQILANLALPLPKRSYRPLRVLPQFSANGINDVLAVTPLQPEAFPRYGSPSSNGRSTLMYLQSSGRVYAASMSMFARINPDGTERAPTLEEWQNLLVSGRLAAPRDISPTPIGSNAVRFFYGRVAGVSQGSQWQGTLTDGAGKPTLTVPRPGQAFSYGLSTVYRGTLGTGQVQSAPMLARYPDTAYLSHGNYAVHYNLKLPLYNPTQQTQAVTLAVQTPLKQDRQGRLDFLNPPAPQIFFRGTVRVTYTDDQGTLLARYVHLVQQRGQRGEPIVVLNLKPGDRRQAEVDFLYPPDATPPQVLTVSTLLPSNLVVTQKAEEGKKVQPKPNKSASGKKSNGAPK